MDIEKRRISGTIQFLQEKHTECRIDLYYDERNLVSCIQNLPEIIENLGELIGILERCKINSPIYVRIHGFNQWIIVQMKIEIRQNWGVEKKIREAFGGDLINITYDQKYQIIKLCYSKS